jgi:hypothetical protein
MSLAYSLLVIVILILIAYQDFRFRAVSWLWFPLLAGIMILDNIHCSTVDASLNIFLLNLAFVVIQLLVVTVYLSIKNKAFVRIWQHHLGLGDILFFMILCLFFSPVNFILFYLGSLICCIIGVLCVRKFNAAITLIPLAGIQSALLVVLIVLNLMTRSIDYHVDVDLSVIL